MKLSLFVPMILCSMLSYCQTFSGTVYDSKTKEPLPFVSIGIMNKGVGTVAQTDGRFTITIPVENANDTLRFSMVGYTYEEWTVAQFRSTFSGDQISILMDEAENLLSEVIIRPKNMRSIVLGNEYHSPAVSAGFESDDLGSEMGTVMRVKKDKQYYLKTAGFNIAKCNYDSILFRVNIYDFKNGRPGEILHSLPLYVTVRRDEQMIRLDLTSYNITVENDFLLSLEWITDLPEKQRSFMFCAGFVGNRIYYRKTSQDGWSSAPVCIGSFCEVEFEK